MSATQSFIFGIALYIMLFPLVIALYKYKIAPPVLKVVTWYLVFVTIVQALIMLLRYQKQHNLFLFHIGNVGESILLLLMYREMFKKYDKNTGIYVYRRPITFALPAIVFIVFAILNITYWQSLDVYPSYTRTTLSIMIIVLSGAHFHKYSYEPYPKSWVEMASYKVTRASLSWINMGLVFYFGASLIRSMFTNLLLKEASKETYFSILTAHAVFSIILYIFIAIGFIKIKRLKSNSDKENRYSVFYD